MKLVRREACATLCAALAIRLALTVLLCAVLVTQTPSEAVAQAPYGDATTAEGWALAQIKQGKTANFDERCARTSSSKNDDEARWNDPCRRVAARFVADLLSGPAWRDQIPTTGVALSGVRLVGDLDLHDARITRPLALNFSLIEGNIDLNSAQAEGGVAFVGSRLKGWLTARQSYIKQFFTLRDSQVDGAVSIVAARIDGYLEMEGVVLQSSLDVSAAQIDSDLVMRSSDQRQSSFRDVNLGNAKVTGNVFMDGAIVAGKLNADALQVAAHLFMRSTGERRAGFQAVILTGVKVGGNLEMIDATVAGELNAGSLSVGAHLLMNSDKRGPSFAGVDLSNAKITGNVYMDGAIVAGLLYADAAQVTGHLFMRSNDDMPAVFQAVALTAVKVGGNLEMTDAAFLGELNASSLTVGAHLLMDSDKTGSRFASVNLGNAKVTGNVVMVGANFGGDLNADSLSVGGHLVMASNQKMSRFQTVTLSNARVTSNVSGDGAFFAGTLNMNAAQVGGNLFMRSLFEEEFVADSMHVAGHLTIGGAAETTTFRKAVSLRTVHVSGDVNADGVNFEGPVTADGLDVKGGWFARGSRLSGLVLRGARINDYFDLSGTVIDGVLDADGVYVGAHLFMQPIKEKKERCSFVKVLLTNARIMGNLYIDHAAVSVSFNAYAAQISGRLEATNSTFQAVDPKDAALNLTNARVAGPLILDGSTFDSLSADGLKVESNVLMRKIASMGALSLTFLRTDGSLDLRGAKLNQVDLSGASVAVDFRLGGGEGFAPATWQKGNGNKPPSLKLRNARVGNLMDTRAAWPPTGSLQIDGFTFTHLGGYEGDSGPDMRSRGMEWWDKWARLDPGYSPVPYEQLAAALVAAGDRSAADEIRFYGRVRQRESESGWPWVYSLFLEYVAGFGIGLYTFRVLYWVLGITVIGALYLYYFAPAARVHGFAWCCGATLSRLLPVIEINKEFSDFFNDPRREKLTGRQAFAFSMVGMMGWVLGAILVAAVSGLTPKV